MQKEKSEPVSIAIAQNELIALAPDLKITDKLAVERTVLAADRTMLAGVRTSLSFIGFGFTIFNVLRYVYEHGGETNAPRDAEKCRHLHAGGGNLTFACDDDSILPSVEADGAD